MCQEFFRTRFMTVPVTTSLETGIPIGQGECKAVRLRLNALIRNNADGVNGRSLIPQVYYGDATSQENELTAGVNINLGVCVFYQSDWTPKIYCQNLEEVFIRSRSPDTEYVHIMIYD